MLVYISICTSSGDYYKQKLHFRLIELLMYLVYIIDQIHQLLNEAKKSIFL